MLALLRSDLTSLGDSLCPAPQASPRFVDSQIVPACAIPPTMIATNSTFLNEPIAIRFFDIVESFPGHDGPPTSLYNKMIRSIEEFDRGASSPSPPADGRIGNLGHSELGHRWSLLDPARSFGR